MVQLQEIQQTLDQHSSILNNIQHVLNRQTPREVPGDMPHLPLSNMEEMMKWEDFIKEDANFSSVVSLLLKGLL